MTELSVIVPTYNQAELLRACLRSLTAQSIDRATYEVIVVDDGSTDDTRAVIEHAGMPVVPIRLPARRGRSAARNAGIRRARASVIVFVDSDVIVRPDFLSRHLSAHRQRGPAILSRGPVVMVADAGRAERSRAPKLLFSPAYLDTANAGIEKDVLIRAGLFDEDFPGYGWEDFELGIRLKRLGVRRVFDRGAVAFHVQRPIHETPLETLLNKEDERARSAGYFFRKHPTLEARLLIQATPIHAFLFWLQAGFGGLTARNASHVARTLAGHGLEGLGYVLLRGVLNQRYLRTLRAELNGHAPAVTH